MEPFGKKVIVVNNRERSDGTKGGMFEDNRRGRRKRDASAFENKNGA